MPDTATTIDTTVERYFETWNAPSGRRRAMAEAAFTPDTYYCDGASEAAGLDAVVAMMDGVAERFPGCTVRLISPVDQHHRQARFAWTLDGADGTTIIDGIDAVHVDADGRIASTLGFFHVDIPA